MSVELLEITDRETLDHLVQLYSYDFTEFVDVDLGPDGRYAFIDADIVWQMPTHDASFICVDRALAGFSLAYEDVSFRDPTVKTWWVAEFFVLRAYRRKDVGRRAATMLFDRLGGTWEVGQIPANESAQAFWRSVIADYTGGEFEEFYVDDERWTGPVQTFNARRTDANR